VCDIDFIFQSFLTPIHQRNIIKYIDLWKIVYVIVKSTFVSVYMVKTLNKCILSSIVSNLFLDRQIVYFCT